jgi:hypothetical protein
MNLNRRLGKLFSVIVALALSCHSASTYASVLPTDRHSLMGLSGVVVMISLNAGQSDALLEGRGISEQQLRTEVELRLRRSGIPVLDSSASENAPRPVLLMMVVAKPGDVLRLL